jgi:hypothetical protein
MLPLWGITLLESCSQQGGCDMQSSNARSLGYVTLSSESQKWAPQTGVDSILFVNNLGAGNFFLVNVKEDNAYEYELYLNQDLSGGPCTTKDYNYVTGKIQNFSLKSANVPFYIAITRMINIKDRLMNDTITLKNIVDLSDKIAVSIGGYSTFEFVLKDTASYTCSDRILVDSFYTHVYEVAALPNPSTSNVVKSAFFQSGKGLIGFQFYDNEIWAQKIY